MDTSEARDYFVDLQQRIVARLEAIDGRAFRRDAWERPAGGEGVSCVIEQGSVFERGGVNFSHVEGDSLPQSATATRPQLAGRGFEVMGVSLVLHPRNPYAPTVHMNVRLFVALPLAADEVAGAHAQPNWWFGGGMDLTPYYGFEDDAIHFHRTCRTALEAFGTEYHPRFKRWCDHAGSAGSSTTISTKAGSSTASHSPAVSPIISCRRTSRSWSGARITRTVSASAISRRIGAAATSNSISSTIAARYSACSPTVARRRS